MIKKMQAVFALFKAGRVVADPAKWKARQITASVITAAIWAAINALSAWGVEVPVGAEIVDAVAVAVLGFVNVLLTVTTTDKIGMQDKPKPGA